MVLIPVGRRFGMIKSMISWIMNCRLLRVELSQTITVSERISTISANRALPTLKMVKPAKLTPNRSWAPSFTATTRMEKKN